MNEFEAIKFVEQNLKEKYPDMAILTVWTDGCYFITHDKPELDFDHDFLSFVGGLFYYTIDNYKFCGYCVTPMVDGDMKHYLR